MVYLLTLDAVREAAAEAYKAGSLGFQRNERECAYVGAQTGAPCAVGAALPEEFRNFIARNGFNGACVLTLADKGFVKFVDDVEARAIRSIQQLHDRIVHVQEGNTVGDAEKLERMFAEKLGVAPL